MMLCKYLTCDQKLTSNQYSTQHQKLNSCEAQLAWKCQVTPSFQCFRIFSIKIGHTDLVFGVRSAFVDGSMRARLQVFVRSGYDLC